MKIFRYIIIGLIICIACGKKTIAQETQVSANLSSDTIIIGQQVKLSLEGKTKGQKFILPALLEDTIIENVEIIHAYELQRDFDSLNNINLFAENYIITSFDTGVYHIPQLKLFKVYKNDTSPLYTNPLSLKVLPYVLLDTIPVDTTYAGTDGLIVFGKNSFSDEIEQMIPDSVRKALSPDSLQLVREQTAQQFFQLFSSQINQQAGLNNQEEIITIAEAESHFLFIIDNNGIKERHIVGGSIDTLFVSEFQNVTSGTPLFTLFRIKDIQDNLLSTPFNLSELWFYLIHFIKNFWWLIIFIIILSLAAYYYFKHYKKGEPLEFLKIKPQDPAHIIALKKLEEIRNQKIWKSGQYKEFHVQTTNVLREYIDKRYGVNALEMTSSEILSDISKFVEDSDFQKIRQVLELADSVKFAKAIPVQNENDLSLKNAFDFVNNTKEEAEEDKHKKLEAEIELKKNSEDESEDSSTEANNKNNEK